MGRNSELLHQGWNCMDPEGRLNEAFQRGGFEPVHELMEPESQPQTDPGVAEHGFINHEIPQA